MLANHVRCSHCQMGMISDASNRDICIKCDMDTVNIKHLVQTSIYSGFDMTYGKRLATALIVGLN